MDIRQITPNYAVSEQILPQECESIAQAGFVSVICNRPDFEIPEDIGSAVVKAAAEDAGLAFHVLPLTHQTLTPENIEKHRELIEAADGPVLAYCASGTRSTIVWALGQAGRMDTADILAAARAGGYMLDHLGPTLEVLAKQT